MVDPMAQAAAELLRAVRGPRSQVAFARRLGYRGNPITDWEHGRRFPTAVEAFRACTRAGIDVQAAFARFHAAPSPRLDAGNAELSRWLEETRGSLALGALAARSGRSRFAVARWLRNQASPRLHDFLRLVDAITGRLPDFVAALVPIERVPSMQVRHDTALAARRLAFEQPWTEAILRVLETRAYREQPHAPGWIAAQLGVDVDTVANALLSLERAGVLREEAGWLSVIGSLNVDTRADAESMQALMAHWSHAALARYGQNPGRDLFAYNVMSISEPDFVRVRELLRATFREIRALVAASEPTERAVLLNLQLVEWCGPSAVSTPPTATDR